MFTAMDLLWLRFSLLGFAVLAFIAAALLAGVIHNRRERALHGRGRVLEVDSTRRMTSWT